MPAILLFVFIYCLWLILVFHVWLWEQGFVMTPLTDWLLSSFSSFFEEIPPPSACLFPTEKEWICPEYMPPATLTPRGHGNIHTGEHYWLRVPYYVPSHSSSLLRESALTYMQKDQTSPSQLNSNGKFWVIQTVSSEATGLFCPLTKAKQFSISCTCPEDKQPPFSTPASLPFLSFRIVSYSLLLHLHIAAHSWISQNLYIQYQIIPTFSSPAAAFDNVPQLSL